ncbi:L,D-transpeptidase [Acidithiobacillus albertensis]|nr:L,D-transpeptidase [Acidithiobacillus albertensis]
MVVIWPSGTPSALQAHTPNSPGSPLLFGALDFLATNSGKWILHSLTNTGVPGANTPNGTWAVYARFPSTRMTGCFPHGECCNDPDVRFVNYFWDGRAVHYFPRLAYGFRQSTGCVELPLKAAQRAYGMIHIGTPVTVMP